MMARKKLLKLSLILSLLATTLGVVPLTLAEPPHQVGGPMAIVNTSNLHQRTGPGTPAARSCRSLGAT
jgi:hypothetical protein